MGATTTANGAVVYDYTLERDALARIKRRVETIGGVTADTRFAYDSAGRLVTVTRDGVTTAAYEYDANGNRVRRTTTAGVETGVVDAQDRLTTYAGVEYRYTDAGELRYRIAGADTTEYHYDAAGALRWVRLPSGSRIDYVIDPMGRRIGKRVDGILTQSFLYESGLRIGAELTPSGEVRTRFVYGTAANVPEYMVRDGQRYRIITDHLGSVRLVVNTITGQVAQQLEYDEYGRVTTNTNSGFQPFGYAGGLVDDATGLTRLGGRDYDPADGRWTAKDPLVFGGGTPNLYSYAGGDPVNNTDPFGLSADTLHYDGSSAWLVNDDGKEVWRGPATSGRPGSTAGDEGKTDFGPIPEGTYTLNPSEISTVTGWDFVKRGLSGIPEGHLWSDWGNNRVRLHEAAGTNTFGRSEFFLHGGRSPGSLGCIDVGTGESSLFPLLKGHSGPITVIVGYPSPLTVTTPLSNFNPAYPMGRP